MVNVVGIEHQITECPGPFVAMGQGCEKKDHGNRTGRVTCRVSPDFCS